MEKINPTSTNFLPPSHLPEAAPPENCTVRDIALKAIQGVGMLLMAAGIGCFIASLQIPAISLVVAGAIALIFGFILKETTPIPSPPALNKQEISEIKTFITSSKENLGEPPTTFFRINDKLFVYTTSQNGLVIQASSDWLERTTSGIYLSNETNDLKINPNDRVFIYQYLTALSAAQMDDLLGDTPLFKCFGYFRNSSHAFSNLQKSLIKYSNTSNLDELIDATNAQGQGSSDQPNTVRETFRAALDLNKYGGIQQTLKEMQNVSKRVF